MRFMIALQEVGRWVERQRGDLVRAADRPGRQEKAVVSTLLAEIQQLPLTLLLGFSAGKELAIFAGSLFRKRLSAPPMVLPQLSEKFRRQDPPSSGAAASLSSATAAADSPSLSVIWVSVRFAWHRASQGKRPLIGASPVQPTRLKARPHR